MKADAFIYITPFSQPKIRMNKEVIFFLIVIVLILLFSFQDLWSGGTLSSIKDAIEALIK